MTDLFTWTPPPPHNGTDTSRAAAESMAPLTASIRADVLRFLHEGAATCDEVEIGLGLSHQTASARIRELSQMGKIRDTGARRATRSGRSARVYVVV